MQEQGAQLPPEESSIEEPACADPSPIMDASADASEEPLLPLEAAAAEVAAAVAPEPIVLSADELAEQVAASNIRVLWRGGITLAAIFSVAASLLINTGLAVSLWTMLKIGIAWEKQSRPERDVLVHTYLSPTIDDGGSGGGGMIKDTAPNIEPLPSIGGSRTPGNLAAIPGNDGFPSPTDSTDSSASGDESLRRPGFISLGTVAAPRIGKKRPALPGTGAGGTGGGGGDHPAANTSGDGTGGGDYTIALSDFVKNPGPGGTGGGMGRGKGAGWDRGFSIDSPPRCLDTPKFDLPPAYRQGLIRVKQSAKFTIWIKPNNTVARIELIQSSGDKLFDGAIEQFYLHARYLAGTRNGEPAELPLPVSYGGD